MHIYLLVPVSSRLHGLSGSVLVPSNLDGGYGGGHQNAIHRWSLILILTLTNPNPNPNPNPNRPSADCFTGIHPFPTIPI